MRLSANHSSCTPPAPARVKERFEKTRSRMVTMRSVGLGEASPTSRIVNNGITMPRLRLVKSSEIYQKNNTKMDIADVFSKWYNILEKVL